MKRRSSRGASAMELATGAFLMIVFSVFAIDLILLNFAMCLNDSVCRDACRAAAQTNNPTSALAAAQTQLRMHATDGNFVSQPTLSSTSSPDFVYQDYAGNPPANQSSFVTVTTMVTVKIPAPIVFFGATFYQKNGTLVMKRRYTFPIITEKFYGS